MAAGTGAGTDTQLLTDLHVVNQMEIQMGQLAKSNGSSKKVKDCGDMLIKDHTKADKQVMDLAKTMKVDLGTGSTASMDSEEQQHGQEPCSASRA